MWILLWKYKKYLLVMGLLGLLGAATCREVNNYADKKVAAALQEEKVNQLGIEADYIDSIIWDKDAIIDSLIEANAKEIKERPAVQEHKKSMAKVQADKQVEIDSFVAQVRDSAVKVVVDSLNWHYKVVVARLEDQLLDAATIEASKDREIGRLNSALELKNTQLAALENFNKKLHEDLASMSPAPKPKESVGHFIVHKVGPVVALGAFVTVGVVKTVNELRAKDGK